MENVNKLHGDILEDVRNYIEESYEHFVEFKENSRKLKELSSENDIKALLDHVSTITTEIAAQFLSLRSIIGVPETPIEEKKDPGFAISITFGERVENHAGMQMLGNLAKEGFGILELQSARERFEAVGVKCELVNLSTIEGSAPAWILIARNAFPVLVKGVEQTQAVSELRSLKWDTQAKMRGRVVNKKARHNLCFTETAQEPDYEQGKGRIMAFQDVSCLRQLRDALPIYLGEKAKNLLAEGNLYYDTSKCGIGYHGDSERKIVIAFRFGEDMPLCYQWYQKGERVGEKQEFVLHPGDMYVMSEKATGFDWKKRNIATLRHAAGCEKYTK